MREPRPESKEAPKAGVLEESEMALRYKNSEGKTTALGEIANPSYGDKEDFFVYDPEIGVHIAGHHANADLRNDEWVKLPNDMGHVSVADFFNFREITAMSGNQFLSRSSELFLHADFRLRLVYELGKALGVLKEESREIFDQVIFKVAVQNKTWTTADLINSLVSIIQDQASWARINDTEKQETINQLQEQLDRIGVLSDDPSISRNGLPQYFYMYARAKGVIAGDAVGYTKALEKFPFAEELLDEYKNNPRDSRYGDDLLVALADFEREMEDVDRLS